jgi:DNA-binding Xre family transcriptional regulator
MHINYTQYIKHSQLIEHDTIVLVERFFAMISYAPLWDTLNNKDMSTYDLIYRHGISANTIYRMKKGKPITTATLNELCFILKCSVSDVLEYTED